MTKLALIGGTPVIPNKLQKFESIEQEEIDAACAVVKSGLLSGYIGAAGEGFLGGPHVRAFEAKSESYFGVKHAIAVNSWTSGLVAAIGAIGIEPGDEIITTPWTMAATATAILHWAGIPVFADIDPETFNISPQSVETLISCRTKAILAVDIFGQSVDIDALREIADRHRIRLICDTAQSPGATYKGRFAGTLADIGGFSFNYHKHIHCGEGGLLVTNDDHLASRMRLIRNHGEAVISTDTKSDLNCMLGFNFRMGEIEAAIATEQLTKLESRVTSRQVVADQLYSGLAQLPGLSLPRVSSFNTHVYYVFGMILDTSELEIDRSILVSALRAEGIPSLFCGYQNIHRLPVFRHRVAYGTGGFPWIIGDSISSVSYHKGLCPVAEVLHEKDFIGLNMCMNELPKKDVELIIEAFHKVWHNIGQLR